MIRKPLRLSFFVDHLNDDDPVSFVRYGDGEFSAMLGREGETCDGQPYTPELGVDLMRTLARPRPYLYGLGPRAATGLGIDVDQFMRRRGLKVEWYDSEVFIDASTSGALLPLAQALRRHKIMTIGPAHLKDNPAFESVCLVETPYKNAYAKRRVLYEGVMRNAHQADVLAFSVGPAAKILMYDLFPALGQTHFLLDFGSVWDLYCGINSRRYMKNMLQEERERLWQANIPNPL